MSEEARKSEVNQTGRAWVVAIIAIIASILISVNNNKLPATASLVLPALGIDTGALSTLMSFNGYVGFVLAFVAATIIMKFGSKKSTLMVLACALVGAVTALLRNRMSFWSSAALSRAWATPHRHRGSRARI